jgi:hypothetical protein
MESFIGTLGVLDVTNVGSSFDTQRSLNEAQNSLYNRLVGLATDCHYSSGQAVDDVAIDVANTITPGEVRDLDRGLHKLNAWAVISVDGSSECITVERDH